MNFQQARCVVIFFWCSHSWVKPGVKTAGNADFCFMDRMCAFGVTLQL